MIQQSILNNIFFFCRRNNIFSLRECVYWHFEADMDRRIETDHRMRIIVFCVDMEVNGQARENKTRDTKNKSTLAPLSFVNQRVSMLTNQNFNGYYFSHQMISAQVPVRWLKLFIHESRQVSRIFENISFHDKKRQRKYLVFTVFYSGLISIYISSLSV